MEQGELEFSPGLHSPDIEILADDEIDLAASPHGHAKHRSFEDEEALTIKPPQVPNNPVKRDKHKHKHKDDRKRERERDKERPSRHGERDRDRERTKHRDRHDKDKIDSYDDRLIREKEKERDRERQRRKEVQELEAEAKRREKSQQERDRLERLERERRKLEREAEREQRDREHREKVRQEQERLAKAEREKERLNKAERDQQRYPKSDREKDRIVVKESRAERSHRKNESERDSRRKAHSTRQDVEKRREKDRDRHRDRRDYEAERSRSRSPYDRYSKSRYRSEYDSEHYDQQSEYMRKEQNSDIHLVQSLDIDDDHEQMADDHDVYHDHDDQPSPQHIADKKVEVMEEGSSESSSDSGSEDSDSDSGSDSEESNQSIRSNSPGEVGDGGNEERAYSSHKMKSKFEYDEEEEEEHPESGDESVREESIPDSRTDNDEYIDETPPPSPVELAPELPLYLPAIQGCRNVDEFHCLNRIEEGTYGVVYRARDKKTDELVALKRLKMEKEKEGFPITSLREINTLLKSQHPNIVTVREIVVGNNMDKIYIVMDYVEHDLKSLMQTMKDPFVIGEVKTLMQQFLRGVAHLHDNWIIHRDLKTSNLLLSHNAILKIGDFGLAREYGSPLKPYTPIVVTLWYRSPELLLGIKEYNTYIDMWSVGCIFAEFLTMKPLFPGKSEIDQLNRIFKELGTPNEKIWPGVSELPTMKKVTFAEYPYNQLRERFSTRLSDKGFDLMNRFLTYDPTRRITAREGLKHEYFVESPMPTPPSMFPTWPAKSEQTTRSHGPSTPRPPSGGKAYAKLLGDDDEAVERGFHMGSQAKGGPATMGFSLKF